LNGLLSEGNVLGRVFVRVPLVEDVVRTVYGRHRLEGIARKKGQRKRQTFGRFMRGCARTAATVSELISLLRNKLDMSSTLLVPEQDQAMIKVQLIPPLISLSLVGQDVHDVTNHA
jgi:hypothetical protein